MTTRNYFFGLPFLKQDEREDCFIDNIVSILPEDEKVQKFSDYTLTFVVITHFLCG
jgi:hypothetical protein